MKRCAASDGHSLFPYPKSQRTTGTRCWSQSLDHYGGDGAYLVPDPPSDDDLGILKLGA